MTSSQDVPVPPAEKTPTPSPKRHCKNDITETDSTRLRQFTAINEDGAKSGPFAVINHHGTGRNAIYPKVELPDYLSDEEREDVVNFYNGADGAGA